VKALYYKPCYTNTIVDMDGNHIFCKGIMDVVLANEQPCLICNICHDQTMDGSSFPTYTAILEGSSIADKNNGNCAICNNLVKDHELVCHGAPRGPNSKVVAHYECMTTNGIKVKIWSN